MFKSAALKKKFKLPKSAYLRLCWVGFPQPLKCDHVHQGDVHGIGDIVCEGLHLYIGRGKVLLSMLEQSLIELTVGLIGKFVDGLKI